MPQIDTKSESLESYPVPSHTDKQDMDIASDAPEHSDTPSASTPTEAPATQTAAPTTIAEPQVIRKGSTGAMLLGGALAAGLGFGASHYMNSGDDFDPALMTSRVDALKSDLDALPSATDFGALEEALATAEAQRADASQSLTGRLDDLRGQLDATAAQITSVEERLTSVELRGQGGDVDATAVAAYGRELATLRDQITAQGAELSALRAEDDAARIAAENARKMAAARLGLSQIEAAIAKGEPFDAALDPLAQAVELPEVLRAAASDGVVSLDALQSDLPAAMRAALADARAAGESGEDGGGRIGSFFRSQFQVRSTDAQDGDSANAVLSRVQAAVDTGDLRAALTEIDTLPASAQAALSDWVSLARARADVQDAVQSLSQSLTEK